MVLRLNPAIWETIAGTGFLFFWPKFNGERISVGLELKEPHGGLHLADMGRSSAAPVHILRWRIEAFPLLTECGM